MASDMEIGAWREVLRDVDGVTMAYQESTSIGEPDESEVHKMRAWEYTHNALLRRIREMEKETTNE